MGNGNLVEGGVGGIEHLLEAIHHQAHGWLIETEGLLGGGEDDFGSVDFDDLSVGRGRGEVGRVEELDWGGRRRDETTGAFAFGKAGSGNALELDEGVDGFGEGAVEAGFEVGHALQVADIAGDAEHVGGGRFGGGLQVRERLAEDLHEWPGLVDRGADELAGDEGQARGIDRLFIQVGGFKLHLRAFEWQSADKDGAQRGQRLVGFGEHFADDAGDAAEVTGAGDEGAQFDDDATVGRAANGLQSIAGLLGEQAFAG